MNNLKSTINDVLISRWRVTHHLDDCHSRYLAYFEVMWTIPTRQDLTNVSDGEKHALLCPRGLSVDLLVCHLIEPIYLVLGRDLENVVLNRERLQRHFRRTRHR